MQDILNVVTTPATGQAFTATAVATNTIPLSVAGRDIGIGKDAVALRCHVVVAAGIAGTEDYEIQIVSATAADGTTGQVVLATTGLITTAQAATRLAAGAVVDLLLPPGVMPATATHYTMKLVGNNSPTITLIASFQPMGSLQNWKPYPSAVTEI
ncbi:MAG TPA: hypothetical protein VFH61_04810 [Thermoleophilia bacterium]|nr:hypothetical protein [Thermoleophilia bacterium]